MEKKSFSQIIAEKFQFLKPEAEEAKDEVQKALAADEYEKRQGILTRMHGLRQMLCRVNCKASTHRPACKAMKKDIERLKEIIL
jgi:phage gp29-like protein